MSMPVNATQFDGGPKREPSDIVIGLDFGTSFTKTVLQDPNLRKAFAVPFDGLSHPDNRYLLPSRLMLGQNGNWELAGWESKGIRGLKVPLMKNPEKNISLQVSGKLRTNAKELGAAFLALVLRRTRIWFLTKWKEAYGHSEIRWQLNLGIPALSYDEEKIKEAFLVAARAAWWLSIQDGPVTFSLAREAAGRALHYDFFPGIDRDFINVVPEVVAEVAGYARSSFRRPGLHLIVDVGASTMDIATFRLDETSGELRYSFLWAEVNDNACHRLHRERTRKVQSELAVWLKALDRAHDHNVLGSHADYQPPGILLGDVDEEFVSRAALPIRSSKKLGNEVLMQSMSSTSIPHRSPAIRKLMAITKKKRDPNSEEWRTGVPLFVCGGGGELRLFREDVMRKVADGLKGYQWQGFRQMRLPMPDELTVDGLSEEDYHRLAVAYGLSFFFQDIGHIVPPSKIEDITVGPIKDVEELFVEKEQV